MAENSSSDSTYLPELMAEKDTIDPSFVHAKRLIIEEIEKTQNPSKVKEEEKPVEDPASCFIDTFSPKMPKVECMIKVPAEEFPSVNFVGRLIGPGGATLKGIQELTNTRIAVLGKGSQRDKKKAEELAESGDPKWAHMKLPLHVKITAIAPIDQAHASVARASCEIIKLIQVDEEDIQRNLHQNMNLQPTTRGRGVHPRGRGIQSSRGLNVSRPTRGNINVPRGSRGGQNQRGARGNGRGQGRGHQRGTARFGPKTQPQMMAPGNEMYNQVAQDYSYEYQDSGMYEGYGEYTDQSYTGDSYTDGYMATESSYGQEQYDMGYGYGEGYSDAYGNGSGDQSQYQPPKPFRGKMIRGGNNSGRGNARNTNKPY